MKPLSNVLLILTGGFQSTSWLLSKMLGGSCLEASLARVTHNPDQSSHSKGKPFRITDIQKQRNPAQATCIHCPTGSFTQKCESIAKVLQTSEESQTNMNEKDRRLKLNLWTKHSQFRVRESNVSIIDLNDATQSDKIGIEEREERWEEGSVH